jgi:hypothetical protein
MYRTATVHCYDVMDRVQVTASVILYENSGEPTHTVELAHSIDVQGVGSGSGDAWLRDALIALIEYL